MSQRTSPLILRPLVSLAPRQRRTWSVAILYAAKVPAPAVPEALAPNDAWRPIVDGFVHNGSWRRAKMAPAAIRRQWARRENDDANERAPPSDLQPLRLRLSRQARA